MPDAVSGQIYVDVAMRTGDGGSSTPSGGGTASAQIPKKQLNIAQQALAIGKKSLPIMAGMAGVQGISGLLRQSRVMSTVLGTISEMVGAVVDLFLMPFMPLISRMLQLLAPAIVKLADIMMGITGFMEKLFKGFDLSEIFKFPKMPWEEGWSIKDLFKDINFVMDLSQWALNPLEKMIDLFVGWAAEAVNKAAGFDLIGWLTNPMNKIIEAIIGIVTGTNIDWQAIWEKYVVGPAEWIWDKVLSPIGRAFNNYVIDPIVSWWKNNMPSWLGGGRKESARQYNPGEGIDPGYAIGTQFVPRTGMYLLHRGEQVNTSARGSVPVIINNTFNIGLKTETTVDDFVAQVERRITANLNSVIRRYA